jgi:hypothetical protein
MEHTLWERIHSRRGRYIRRIFIAWNTTFANEFAPTVSLSPHPVFAAPERCAEGGAGAPALNLMSAKAQLLRCSV